ncbi:uncharacterized conserved protein [Hahella chejuensis KCTC 2396]|uniref:Uncharacterized conserved protein n=2 Tax=Hahella chejuensis TaxID=158327 RepID=Q2SLM1_HAHCH|nr:uncharacterized conserved protein [Hahella chejuensis KCTC 2396]
MTGSMHLMIKIQKLIYSLLLIIGVAFNASAASKVEIDAKVNAALKVFYNKVPSGQELAAKAQGVLVFPEILKAGFIVGGEYGDGALVKGGAIQSYYNIASASIGFQAGVQEKTVVMLFMTSDALNKFTRSEGWEVGVDGSVAIAEFGAGKSIDTNTIQEPIIAFVVSNKGLMAGVSLEGSKITPIVK